MYSFKFKYDLCIIDPDFDHSSSLQHIFLAWQSKCHDNTFANVYDNCGIAGENRPTGAKFPMEIIDF